MDTSRPVLITLAAWEHNAEFSEHAKATAVRRWMRAPPGPDQSSRCPWLILVAAECGEFADCHELLRLLAAMAPVQLEMTIRPQCESGRVAASEVVRTPTLEGDILPFAFGVVPRTDRQLRLQHG